MNSGIEFTIHGLMIPSLHLMKVHVSLDPIDVTAFRMDRVVMEPEHIAHLVQELRGLRLTFHFGLLFFGDDYGFAPIIDPGLFDLD